MAKSIMREACGFGMRLFNRTSGRSLRLKGEPDAALPRDARLCYLWQGYSAYGRINGKDESLAYRRKIRESYNRRCRRLLRVSLRAFVEPGDISRVLYAGLLERCPQGPGAPRCIRRPAAGRDHQRVLLFLDVGHL